MNENGVRAADIPQPQGQVERTLEQHTADLFQLNRCTARFYRKELITSAESLTSELINIGLAE
ncbi:hypothetical protein PSPTOT1_2264 [Pseudomonas syringae pv. tomato T1]|nr:hypothetical protein PSPTOT1_2264 [Pseudomonas syringae pv. tomato T1]